MSRARFTEEFKIAAVKRVADHGRPVAEVAARLSVSTPSMYAWLKRYNTSAEPLRSGQNTEPDFCVDTWLTEGP